METWICAIDHGTTSSRCILFNTRGEALFSSQKEHLMIYPQPGWVEQDPEEIWELVQEVIRGCLSKAAASASEGRIAAIGITNQRETTLVWDKNTGKSYGNALVWQDTRSSRRIEALKKEKGDAFFRERTGLPLSTYFSASKMEWIIQQHPGLKEKMARGEALCGTMDSYLIWQLSGGPSGGRHVTDITNAGRTQLMGIESLQWEDELLKIFGIPRPSLPEILPSIPEEPFALTEKSGPFGESLPILAVLGDQQAALFGQACDSPGSCKNTYGTGCFMLMNTGEKPVQSTRGLLCTPAYQWGSRPARYALEGSVAVAGALVQWVRDKLGLIQSAAEIDRLAEEVEDCGDVYFVPAFSGLYAPYWRPDARGVISGLTAYAGKAHLARAVLESTAFQSADLLEAMEKDSGLKIEQMKVDGGMVASRPLMQFQSDILDIPLICPEVRETTALGAAYAAGLNAGIWSSTEEIHRLWQEAQRWEPQKDASFRSAKKAKWKKAVKRSLGWLDQD